MKEIQSITIFTGKDAFTLDLSNYTKIIDNTVEYQDSITLLIDFFIGNELVRRLWNPSCDIIYKDQPK